MSLRDLSPLLRPRSIALLGAAGASGAAGVSAGAASLAAVVTRNLTRAGFTGSVSVIGTPELPTLAALSFAPDLVVLCGPVDTIPAELEALARRGSRAALVLSGTGQSEAPALAAAEIRAAARALGIRLIGPDCFGVQVPALGLDATVAASPPPAAGTFGLIVQSTTVCAAILDWARPQGIGFSTVIGLGHALDVDFGDALDYLGSDPATGAILMVIDTIRERREFIAAARAAARNKPVLAMKIGVDHGLGGDGESHSVRLARPDAVYDAVLRRAGILRVADVRELFAAAETLSHTTPIGKGALTILANGHGIATLAADHLGRHGGQLVRLADETKARLIPLTSGRRAGNPVDLGPYADGTRYKAALDTLLDAREVDTVMVMHVPTGLADPVAAAEAVIAAQRGRRISIIACWIGQELAPARQSLRDAGIPTFETPTDAIRAFVHFVEHQRGQDMLMEMPPSTPAQFAPETQRVRALVGRALASNRFFLPEPEARAILTSYGIRFVATEFAPDPAEAGRIARRLGVPVALKILSRDVPHKSAYGGVILDLPGAFEVEKAGHSMIARIRDARQGARIDGFTVQPMVRSPGAVEIMIGMATDPVFGPVIVFGRGGTAVEEIGDTATALPPLNMTLARELIRRARVFRSLEGNRGQPAADLDAIAMTLTRVSQLVVDIPEIVEMDINPLFADANGALALDARIAIAPPPKGERLAIRPYPAELEEMVTLRSGGRVLLRPIRPEDERNHYALVSQSTREDLRFRFFTVVSEVPHSQMARLTQIDYVREMAFVAVPADDPGRETLGVVRIVADADNLAAEFAILVRSDVKGQGIGRLMLEKMIRYCRGRGLHQLVGEVMTENRGMLRLAESLGFRRQRFLEGDTIEVVLALHNEATEKT